MKAYWVATHLHIKNFLIHMRYVLFFIVAAYFFPVDSCLQSKKVGSCRAAVPRLFYKQETEQCESFIWGGCKPNGNNFKKML